MMALDSSYHHQQLSLHHNNASNKHVTVNSPSSAHEPMVMGSPSSPGSPVPGHSHSQYLPGYLLGEHTPSSVVQSSPGLSARLWSSSSGNTSNPVVGGRLSAGSGQSPQMFSSMSRGVLMDKSKDVLHSGRSKNKVAAPPVQGLLESSAACSPSITHHQSMIDTLETSRHQLAGGYSMPLTPQNCHNVSRSQIHHSTPAFGGVSNLSISAPHGVQQSPTQIDPFYTQGESLSPYDVLDDTWVTVFGFPPAAVSYVLSQFSQYGTIMRHAVSNEGNWMHIRYQTRIQVKKALSKNGKIIGNNIMVGVTPCIDKSVMNIQDENSRPANTTTTIVGPNSFNEVNTSKREANTGTPIRPLTAAYKAAAADTEIVPNNNLPKKREGMVSKAMEYIFGW